MTQHVVTTIIVAYVAFCFLYGYASLRKRRQAVAGGGGREAPVSFGGICSGAGHVVRLSCGMALPVLLLSTFIGIAGRERTGVVESSGLFTVAPRADSAIAFLAEGRRVRKGEVVARFQSEPLEHRLASLEARRKELLAAREALKASLLTQPAIELAEQQSLEQRLSQLDQSLADVQRSQFSARERLAGAKNGWERARADLTARIPGLAQSLSAQEVEHRIAAQALARMTALRERGYTTLPQVERAMLTEATARHRLGTTRDQLESARYAISKLDEGYAEQRRLLQAQLENLEHRSDVLTARRDDLAAKLEAARPAILAKAEAAAERRRFELEAATARIAQLENEIAGTVAEGQVRSPVGGRVLYRNAASSTLNGALPLLVVAPQEGFLMRVDLSRDETDALRSDAASGVRFEAVVNDGNVRRLVAARLVRIDDDGLDPSRVTAVFGLEIPEEMLVRMALTGKSPTGALRWTPSTYDLVSARLAGLLPALPGETFLLAFIGREPKAEPPVRPTSAARGDRQSPLSEQLVSL